MTTNAIALPVILPFVCAVVLLALRLRLQTQWLVALLLCGVNLLIAGWITYQTVFLDEILILPLGGWAPSLGVVWIADGLSAIMLLLAGIIYLAICIFTPGSFGEFRRTKLFWSVQLILIGGVNGCFITGDLFNLIIFFEIVLAASYVQMSMGHQSQALVSYVLFNLFISAMFLTSVGLIYGSTGSVNMAELSLMLRGGGSPGAVTAAITLMLMAFAAKAGVVPLYFWMPDSYPRAPVPISALYGGLLTKVGVYALFRTTFLLVDMRTPMIQQGMLIIAGASMILGVIGAFGRDGIREILSFHIVSQVGYMIFGLAIHTKLAVASALYFIFHQSIVKSALFMTGGIAEIAGGSGKLASLRGLYGASPTLAIAFLLPAISLAGLPPFSGFWGKALLVLAGFKVGAWWVTTIAIVTGFLTLASMLKIWSKTFWGETTDRTQDFKRLGFVQLGPPICLGVMSLLLGLTIAPLLVLVEKVAAQLLAVDPYIDAVFSETLLQKGAGL